MTEAIRVYVRYDVPDENGQTRRERNERFGKSEESPLLEISDEGLYLWNWYFELSQSLLRVRSGVCEPIPPSEFIAWCQATRKLIEPVEYDILRAMDHAFCDEMNKEISDYNERLKSSNSSPPVKGKRR